MGPLVPPHTCPHFPRMLIKCQKLAGHPTQMEHGQILGCIPEEQTQTSPEQWEPKGTVFEMLFMSLVWLAQKGSVLCHGKERALSSRGHCGCDNGHLEEASLAWRPDIPAWELMVQPSPPACSAHPIPSAVPIPIALTRVARLSLQCRLIPHSSVISERSSSSNSSRLMSWVSLEGAEMVPSPTAQGTGRMCRVAYCPRAGAALPALEGLSRCLLGRKTREGAPSRGDGSVPTEWLSLAWSAAVGRQEERAPSQPLVPKAAGMCRLGEHGTGSRAKPYPRMFGSHHPREALGLSQTPNGAKTSVTEKGWGSWQGTAGGWTCWGSDHIETHRPCKHHKPAFGFASSYTSFLQHTQPTSPHSPCPSLAMSWSRRHNEPPGCGWEGCPGSGAALGEDSDFPLHQNHSLGCLRVLP